MCGIAGICGPAASVARAEAMVAAMRHRGPDAAGTWSDGEVVLGACRLAVLGLGSSADQPLTAADGARTAAYNGEIYNFRELAEGTPLRTGGDTEVFVELALAARPERLADARGMYAGALHDGQRVHLCRDPFGMKPLYLAEVEGGTVFASELRGMLASGLVPAAVAPTAVVDMLRYGAMVGERSPLSAVRRVRPATALALGSGAAREVPAADPDHPDDGLASVVRGSVAAHLAADVEVGLFLSGGVDSAVVARCLSDLGVRARAITLRTPGTADEVPDTGATAERYGLDHLVVDVDEERCVERALAYLDAMDVPAADGLNTFLVAGAAADAGLKVCLSGTGGDEIFGGYAISARLDRLGTLVSRVPMRDAIAGAVATTSRGRRTRRMAEVLRRAGDRQRLLDIAHRILVDSEVDELAGPAGGSPLMATDDVAGYLRDVLLADADVFGMANGVEMRVPFVDRFVLARARRDAATKRDLVAAFHDPHLERLARQPKRGFTLPYDRWLRGPLDALWRRLLQPPPRCLAGMLEEEAVASLATAWRSRLGPVAMEVWTVAMLYQWGDRHDRHLP